MWCKNDKHQLPKCPDFQEQSLNDKRKHVTENKLCYGCLKPGHNAKECRYRLTCYLCKEKHPTCLHDENYKACGRQQGQDTTVSTDSNTTETTEAKALNVTSGGQSCNTSMIVPVWVSLVTDPAKEELVYTLLDTQSDSTFINNEVSN